MPFLCSGSFGTQLMDLLRCGEHKLCDFKTPDLRIMIEHAWVLKSGECCTFLLNPAVGNSPPFLNEFPFRTARQTFKPGIAVDEMEIRSKKGASSTPSCRRLFKSGLEIAKFVLATLIFCSKFARWLKNMALPCVDSATCNYGICDVGFESGLQKDGSIHRKINAPHHIAMVL